jgi:acetylornithine/succinyldiaminopimelate/putrescine aminotransferase
MLDARIYKSIMGDREANPERLSATLNRIEEIVTVVLGSQAAAVSGACAKDVADKGANLSEEDSRRIAGILGSFCTPNEIRLIVDMLDDSEFSSSEAIDLHRRFKIPVSRLEDDIIPVRGDGAWIVDTRGNAYLDMDSNYSATNLGLNNPEIARGLFNQATQLISMKEDRVHIPRARFLSQIHQMMPPGLTQFYWQNSGGEAVDKALKIAKAYTRSKGVVAMKGGFHGRTHGAVAVTHEPRYRSPFFLDDEDWVNFVEFNDADAVEDLFERGKARSVILELVQGEEAGIRPADKSYVKALRKTCDEHDALMIVDEIQTGFGRTAEKPGQWFASMVYDIVPDIMTIGKSFGGGYPVTAVVTNETVSAAMKPGYDGSTFGGNPMAMVAAMIATRQMREKDVTRNVILRSEQIRNGLERLSSKHSNLVESRGLGLMIAFRLPSADEVADFQLEMAKNRVKTSLSTREWVRLLPPLVITESDTEHLIHAIDKSLEAVR